MGLDWRPTALPLRLVAEQRFALDGGRGGPALAVSGGFGPTPSRRLPARWLWPGRRDRRAGIELFVDGGVRAARPVARSAARGSISAAARGAGRSAAWRGSTSAPALGAVVAARQDRAVRALARLASAHRRQRAARIRPRR